MPRRILLVAATTGYQLRVFEETARRMGLDIILATDRCHQLDDPWGDHALPVRFEKPNEAMDVLAGIQPPDGVVAVGDGGTPVASLAAAHFGLPFHPFEAVTACRDKYLARERFRQAGLPVPAYSRVRGDTEVSYPCVLKPLGLSGSRGVIRANNPAEFKAAFDRIRALPVAEVQVEDYIPGREYAVEGIVTDGQLQALAIFDKPDPLEGPFFEETIYVTPSRGPVEALIQAAQDGIRALDLTHGPIHAEMRHNQAGVWLLEIAARPIGGLCAGALRFADGMPLEELILRHALGEDVRGLIRETAASGVMMIPIPMSGIYQGVEGVEEASAVPSVERIAITAKPGQRLLMLPEGASYLGFIFARAETPEAAEQALREAHHQLRFTISGELKIWPAGAYSPEETPSPHPRSTAPSASSGTPASPE